MRLNKHLKAAALFLLIVVQSCSSSGDKDSITNTVAGQNDLPQMVVTKPDGSQLNTKELTGKIVLILFQTDCDHCQREAAAIQENISAFKPYSVYFITTSSHQQIETFAKEYKLADYPNVHFCQTTSQSVLDNFGHIDAPSLYIFASDRTLVKSFNGETPINEILKYI